MSSGWKSVRVQNNGANIVATALHSSQYIIPIASEDDKSADKVRPISSRQDKNSTSNCSVLHAINNIILVDGMVCKRLRQEVAGELGAATSCPPSSEGAGRRRTSVMKQRAVLRPYLHHVLDEWFVKDVQPRMKGRCFLTR